MNMTNKEIFNYLAEKGIYLQTATLNRLTEKIKASPAGDAFTLLYEAEKKFAAKNTDPKKGAYTNEPKREALKKAVLKLDKNTGEVVAEYESIYAAVISAGLDSRFSKNIKDCCNGKRKSVYGFKYAWLEQL